MVSYTLRFGNLSNYQGSEGTFLRDVAIQRNQSFEAPSRATGSSLAPAAAPHDAPRAEDIRPRGAQLEDKARALNINQESYDILQSAARPSTTQKPKKPSADATAHTVKNPQSRFVATVQKNFKKWDKNNDGTLQNTEIDAAVANPKFKGSTAAALAGLEALEDKPDFKGFGATQLKSVENAHRQGNRASDNLMAYYEQQIDRFHSEKTLYGKDGEPSINDISQGSQGDCFFLSALGSKVLRDPQSVKDMIKSNADGSYTVSFTNGDVNLKMPTDTQAARSSNGEKGRWVPLMEKAFAIYTRDGIPGADRDPYESIGRGGTIDRAMTALGSSNPTTYGFNSANPSQHHKLGDVRDAMSTFVSDQKWVNGVVSDSPLGLPEGHAYTIEGYDRETDRVTVRNPWGSVGAASPRIEDQGQGVFTLAMDDFLKNFSHIVVG